MSNANKPTAHSEGRDRAAAKAHADAARKPAPEAAGSSHPGSNPSSNLKKKSRIPAPGSANGSFDKAFPVWLDGELGATSGIGRNITEAGMFVETREPLPLGSRVRVTFAAPSSPTEMTLEAEVRYQCFINFAKDSNDRTGLRGMGLRFVAGARTSERGGTLH